MCNDIVTRLVNRHDWHSKPMWQQSHFKGTLYIIWCGVNRHGDSGVKVHV